MSPPTTILKNTKIYAYPAILLKLLKGNPKIVISSFYYSSSSF
jgi:hypothetical protein